MKCRRRDMSLVMQSLARPSSGISKDHLLQALITTRKQEMIERKYAFYDELNSILYGDDNIEPLAVYSNRKGLVKRNQPEKSGVPNCKKVRRVIRKYSK